MYKVLCVKASEDLRAFSRQLDAAGIPHRISERSGEQIIWVDEREQVEGVKKAYLAQAEKSAEPVADSVPPQQERQYDEISPALVWERLKAAPLTSLFILLSTLATLAIRLPFGEAVFTWLHMAPLAYLFESFEFWRLLTPAFLHFTFMHLVFNMLMLWVFGHQIERRESPRLLVGLFLLLAVLPNLVQFAASGPNFGGMSGLVYGVLAFCWQWDRLNPDQAYGFPPQLMGFMMFWLVLGYTDVLAWVGFGHMANAAHLSGLACGLIFAFALTLWRTPGSNRRHHINRQR